MVPIAIAAGLLKKPASKLIAKAGKTAVSGIVGLIKGSKKKKLEKAVKEENQRVYMIQKDQVPIENMPESSLTGNAGIGGGSSAEFSFWEWLKNLFN